MSGRELPEDWLSWRDQLGVSGYDERWAAMARAGHNPHGEADFVWRYRPESVLDAGCGTGRVAIELARRGVRVLGVDADADMIASARAKAPSLAWAQADLAEFETMERFDVVLLAGNVIPYVAADRRAAAVLRCAAVLAPGGRLIAGFALRSGWPDATDYDGWCAAAGLVSESRYGTWEGAPPRADYLLAVHRNGS
jgi:SAM-dependent methyltransferase